jgi:hypothetical protein
MTNNKILIVKKLFCIISLILITNTFLYSQSLEHILDTTKQWNILHVDSPPGGSSFSTHKIVIVGDTVYNDEHYFKMGVSYSPTSPPIYNGMIMREDTTGKVWGATFYGINIEHQGLMYDFSLNVGDTITPYSALGYYYSGLNFEVLEIDTVYFANKNRKRIALGFTGETEKRDYWYEGIGSSLGLIHPGLIIIDINTELLCYYKSDTLLWHNPEFPNCWYNNVNVKSDSFDSDIYIYPNPADDRLNIDILDLAQL